MNALRCETFESFESAAEYRAQWDRFVLDVHGSIYMSFDWCRIWWEYYGQQRRLQIYVLWEGHELVGIVPMFIDRLRFAVVQLRIAKLMGSDFCQKLADPAIRDSWVEPVMERILNDLLENGKCDAVWFAPLSELCRTVTTVREVCSKNSSTLTVARSSMMSPHTVFVLPVRFDEYMESLDPHVRKDARYGVRRFAREYNLSVETCEDGDQLEHEFNLFKQMHDRQWNSQGKRGHFGSWPRATDFNVAMIRSFSKLGRVRLFRISANDHVVAYQYGYVFGDCYYWILPAREVGEEWDRLSLGVIAVVKMIEMLIPEGVRRIEAGLGHYEYKLRYGGKEYAAHALLVTRNRSAVWCRTRLYVLASRILDVVYHNIIYRRLALNCSFLRRPLWGMWVRSQM